MSFCLHNAFCVSWGIGWVHYILYVGLLLCIPGQMSAHCTKSDDILQIDLTDGLGDWIIVYFCPLNDDKKHCSVYG